jgi:hypothetical protein
MLRVVEACNQLSGSKNSAPEAILWKKIIDRQRSREQCAWNDYINSTVTMYSGEEITLGEWVRVFVRKGLIPFLSRKGFTVIDSIENKLLYLLYSLDSNMFLSIPYPKHRNSNTDRWLFESTIRDRDWDGLFYEWGVECIFENGMTIREVFPEFVYVFLSLDKCRRIQDNDEAERRAAEDLDAYINEQDNVSWAALRASNVMESNDSKGIYEY